MRVDMIIVGVVIFLAAYMIGYQKGAEQVLEEFKPYFTKLEGSK